VRLAQFIPPDSRRARRGLRDLSLVGLDLPLCVALEAAIDAFIDYLRVLADGRPE
jgi:hypothetical protein